MKNPDNTYKNAIGDWFISKEKRELQQAELALEQRKTEAILALADKPVKSNKLLYLIPIAVIVVGGIIAVFALKRKK